MLLTIDVGNTNITIGVYKDEKIIAHFRLSTVRERARDEYGIMFLSFLQSRDIKPSDISAVVIASVVPQVMYSLERAVYKYIGIEPVVIKSTSPLGMNILIDNPKELGADRIVNAYAAKKIYGTPIVIVDFGTATTFCAINRDGEYLGGAICPGIKISVDALFTKTSKLPQVEILATDNVIGKNTVESMQSGVFHGYVGQVNYLASKMREEMGEPDAKIIATGGLANMISQATGIFCDVNMDLTLEGLKMIYNDIFK
ncbi:MAG: type III pantothenate kinase [Clostridia bacterium]|nr:type III pantothenate kinase [Clostridia bacterium]